MPTDFRGLMAQLNGAQVRYVIVGGLAMLLRGIDRLTADVFTENPLPFDELWRDSELLDAGGAPCRVASLAHLVRLKRLAGRPRDLEDAIRLERLAAERQK